MLRLWMAHVNEFGCLRIEICCRSGCGTFCSIRPVSLLRFAVTRWQSRLVRCQIDAVFLWQEIERVRGNDVKETSPAYCVAVDRGILAFRPLDLRDWVANQ
jgi:hypothetical protein